MAPPTATETETQTYTPSKGFVKPDDQPEGTAPNEPKLTQGGKQPQEHTSLCTVFAKLQRVLDLPSLPSPHDVYLPST